MPEIAVQVKATCSTTPCLPALTPASRPGDWVRLSWPIAYCFTPRLSPAASYGNPNWLRSRYFWHHYSCSVPEIESMSALRCNRACRPDTRGENCEETAKIGFVQRLHMPVHELQSHVNNDFRSQPPWLRLLDPGAGLNHGEHQGFLERTRAREFQSLTLTNKTLHARMVQTSPAGLCPNTEKQDSNTELSKSRRGPISPNSHCSTQQPSVTLNLAKFSTKSHYNRTRQMLRLSRPILHKSMATGG